MITQGGFCEAPNEIGISQATTLGVASWMMAWAELREAHRE